MQALHRRLAALIMLPLLLGLAACSSTATPVAEAAQAAPSSGALPVWPEPPAAARVRYLRSVSAAADWGITKSPWRRLWDALTGAGKERLVRPTGVAEQDGVLYVADAGAPALWIFDAPRNQATRIVGAGELTLVSPVAVAPRPDGAVFVADTFLKKILLFDRQGRLLRVAAETSLQRPAGLAYAAASERLYVADSATQKISVFGPDGALLRSWGGAGSADGEFNRPTHLALERDGTLLVTDALNFRIQAFDPDGRFLWKLGRHGDGSGDLAAPKGLAADSAGHVFIVDALFDALQIFARDGSLLLGLGAQGARPGQFWLPGGLFIDAQDRVFVADAYNRRIQVLQAGPSAAGATPKASP